MQDITEVARAVRQVLESYRRAGITHLEKPRGGEPGLLERLLALRAEAARPQQIDQSAASNRAPSESTSPAAIDTAKNPLPGHRSERRQAATLLDSIESEAGRCPSLSVEEKTSALAVLQNEVRGCTRCSELAGTRTQTVFGVGNPASRLVFLGEAPGADEDRLGEPFVGRAGQLLTDIITKGMKLRRQDVYILNVLKCRPPNNRDPAPNEVINCRGFLDRQLEIIQPEYICCLGSIAAKTLLDTNLSIGRLRKKFHDYRGIPVLCTYHPAYVLRNPAAKADVWEDIKVLMKRMGMTVGGGAGGG